MLHVCQPVVLLQSSLPSSSSHLSQAHSTDSKTFTVYLTEDGKGCEDTGMLGLGFRITLVQEKKNPLNRQCK